MPSREQQILSLLRSDPMMPQQQLAETLGISRSAVAGHIMRLTDKGLIKGRGYVLSESPFVAVVGGANIDIHGKSFDRLRDKDSNPGTVHTSAGGVARNIAENLARLDVDTRLVSAIGADYNGQLLLRLSREAGINVNHVHEIAAAPTSSYLSVINGDGEMRLAVADMSIFEHLTASRLESQKAMLREAALIVMDTNLGDEAIAWLCASFPKTPLFVDTVSASKAERIKPYLASVHTLKMSELEAEALTGLKARTSTQLKKIASTLQREGVSRVFVSRGAAGVFYSTEDAQGTEKSTATKPAVRNTSGAGDAFLAGLVYGWLNDLALVPAIRFGLAAASITLSHAATSSPVLSVAAVNRSLEQLRA